MSAWHTTIPDFLTSIVFNFDYYEVFPYQHSICSNTVGVRRTGFMQQNLDCVFLGSVFSYVLPKWKFSTIEVYGFYPVPQLYVQTERKVALCSRFQIPSFGNWWGRGGIGWFQLYFYVSSFVCMLYASYAAYGGAPSVRCWHQSVLTTWQLGPDLCL